MGEWEIGSAIEYRLTCRETVSAPIRTNRAHFGSSSDRSATVIAAMAVMLQNIKRVEKLRIVHILGPKDCKILIQ